MTDRSPWQVTGPSAQLLLQIIEGVSFSVLESIPAPRSQDIARSILPLGSFESYIWLLQNASNIYRCPSPALAGRSDLTWKNGQSKPEDA